MHKDSISRIVASQVARNAYGKNHESAWVVKRAAIGFVGGLVVGAFVDRGTIDDLLPLNVATFTLVVPVMKKLGTDENIVTAYGNSCVLGMSYIAGQYVANFVKRLF